MLIFLQLCLTDQNKYQIAFFLNHFLNLLEKFCYLENKETQLYIQHNKTTKMVHVYFTISSHDILIFMIQNSLNGCR
jgi:hypothetical protein